MAFFRGPRGLRGARSTGARASHKSRARASTEETSFTRVFSLKIIYISYDIYRIGLDRQYTSIIYVVLLLLVPACLI